MQIRLAALFFATSGVLASVAVPPSRPHSLSLGLIPRQDGVCPIGTRCGVTCAFGECCSHPMSLSCRTGTNCVLIEGIIGCCPAGETCDSIRTCRSATHDSCRQGTPSPNESCCKKDTPICDSYNGVTYCRALKEGEAVPGLTTVVGTSVPTGIPPAASTSYSGNRTVFPSGTPTNGTWGMPTTTTPIFSAGTRKEIAGILMMCVLFVAKSLLV